MRSDLTVMTPREIHRLEAVQRFEGGLISQAAAARELGISIRQAKRAVRSRTPTGPTTHQANDEFNSANSSKSMDPRIIGLKNDQRRVHDRRQHHTAGDHAR